MNIISEDVLASLRNGVVKNLFAVAVQTVNDRADSEREHARIQEQRQRAAYQEIQAACAAQLPPNLRPYVSQLLTDGIILPVRASDIVALELHFPELELPLRARFYLQARTQRGPGQWIFQDYFIPGVHEIHGPAGVRKTYTFEERSATRAFDLQDALAYLLTLVAEYRSVPLQVVAQPKEHARKHSLTAGSTRRKPQVPRAKPPSATLTELWRAPRPAPRDAPALRRAEAAAVSQAQGGP